MTRAILLFGLIFFIGLGGVAASNRVEVEDVAFCGDEEITSPQVMIGFSPLVMRMNTILGDTIIVGSTGWDQQHNGAVGRQISYHENDGISQVSLAWMKLTGIQTPLPRYVVQTVLSGDAMNGFVQDPLPAARIENGYRSGYVSVSANNASGVFYPSFHRSVTSLDNNHSVITRRSPFIPGVWNLLETPASEHIWPKSAYGSDGYIHVVNHHTDGIVSTPTQLSYMSWWVSDDGALVPAMRNDVPRLMSNALMNVSSDIVTNRDGSRVAVAACVDRNRTEGEHFRSGNGNWNNDIYLWQSSNSGSTFDSPVNVSDFIGTFETPTPDTLFANGDTLRSYTDCSLVFDDRDRLHVAFTAANFDYLREEVFYESRIFHWMLDGEGNQVWTMINYQPYNGQPEKWGRTTDRPSLYFDDDTGILWCVMEAVDAGTKGYDYGRSTGLANTDIFISASPPGDYNGLLWTRAVNITNSAYNLADGAPVGFSRSETDMSVAIDSDGDFLHLFYMLDLDAGCAVQGEGVMTDNPMVYHSVSKESLLQQFEDAGQWVQNYPLHVNEYGFWQDPGEWKWEEHGGFFTTRRVKHGDITVTMRPQTPDIAAEGGIASAFVSIQNHTDDEYSGLDFWAMITFPTGEQHGPVLCFEANIIPRWFAPNLLLNQVIPGTTPYGRYQYSLYIGTYPDNIMASDDFMFTKVPGVADGEPDEFDPSDWPVYMTPIVSEPTQEIVDDLLPQGFTFSEAWPNPFNPTTTLQLHLPMRSHVRMAVFDLMGRQVQELSDGIVQSGTHNYQVDGTDLASGMYFVRATIENQGTFHRKLVLMK